MKTKRYKIVYLIIAVLVAVFTVGCAFAWLAEDRKEQEAGFGGSSGSAYFAGGDGLTAKTAYQITDKYHMYNLAWLQNTGKFINDQGNPQQFFFELRDNVDMGDMWLPPIGTEDDPFMGDFNGNGKTISGLKVTTDKSKLTSAPDSQVAFSNSVGMFGITEKDSQVHNFILEAPIVEVATGSNAPYSSGEKVAGLAVGLVGGKCYSVGVLADQNASGGAQLLMQRKDQSYSTFNSIIGGLKSGVTSSVTGGGAPSVGLGGTLNFLEMMRRMSLMDDNSWATPKREFKGFNSTSTSRVTSRQYMPLVVSNAIDTENDTYYSGTNRYEEVPDTNIGFYVGAESKIKPIAITNFNTNKIYTAKVDGDNVSRVEKTDLDEKISNTLTNDIFKQDYLYGIKFNESIGSEDWIKIENTNVAGYKNTTVTIPPNTVWFAAQETGFAKFIYSSQDIKNKVNNDVVLYRIERPTVDKDKPYYTALANEGSNTAGYGSASAYGNVSGVTVTQITSAYENTMADGKIEYSYGNALTGATLSKLVYDFNWYNSNFFKDAGQYDLFYSEIPIIKGCEYAIGDLPSGNTWIMYMDIGQNAGEQQGGYDEDKNVSAVDFIYSGVSIKQEKAADDTIDIGNFIVSANVAYEATMTSIYFKQLQTALKIVYIRRAVDDPDDKRIAAAVTITGTTTGTTNPVVATVDAYAVITKTQ